MHSYSVYFLLPSYQKSMSVTQIPASTADVKIRLASTIVLVSAATVESIVTSSKVKQVIDKWL